MVRPINQAGISLIKSFESFRSYPYRDVNGVWTQGYGETHGINEYSTPITEDQAEDMLANRMLTFGAFVERYIHVALNDNQYSALVSLSYNAGTAPLVETLGHVLNKGDYAGAANHFANWVYCGHEISDGLVRRRAAEKALFLTPVAA